MTIKPRESLNRRIEGAFLALLRAERISTVSEQVLVPIRIILWKGKYRRAEVQSRPSCTYDPPLAIFLRCCVIYLFIAQITLWLRAS